jgi:glutathione S-transferase
MKLYFSAGSCSLAPHIVLQELGLKFETEAVNLKTKQTASGKYFTTINPKGSVPTLHDHGAFREHLSIVELQCRNASFGVNGREVFARGRLLRL